MEQAGEDGDQRHRIGRIPLSPDHTGNHHQDGGKNREERDAQGDEFVEPLGLHAPVSALIQAGLNTSSPHLMVVGIAKDNVVPDTQELGAQRNPGVLRFI
ncbi:MAG: hypothetical protein ABW123_02540, partial [Cystobacter sp.]